MRATTPIANHVQNVFVSDRLLGLAPDASATGYPLLLTSTGQPAGSARGRPTRRGVDYRAVSPSLPVQQHYGYRDVEWSRQSHDSGRDQ